MHAAYYDMHCHPDFLASSEVFAAEAQQLGLYLLGNTVTPAGYVAAHEKLSRSANVRLACGLHPWWVTDDAADDALLAEILPQVDYVGEVGLDFGRRGYDTRERQVEVFTQVAHVCTAHPGKVLSIHSIKAVDAVLDILQQQKTLDENICIFHWFSGSSDQLQRAIAANCRFSVGPGMIASRRGRAYVQAIPAGMMLTETDAPAEDDTQFTARRARDLLDDVHTFVEQTRGREVVQAMRENARVILGL